MHKWDIFQIAEWIKSHKNTFTEIDFSPRFHQIDTIQLDHITQFVAATK